MIHCKVYHAWRPTKWEGYEYTDTETPCIYVTDHLMNASGWCSKASITGRRLDVIKTKNDTNHAVVQPTANNNSGVVTKSALYKHQQEAVQRYNTEKEIALFFECGTGKSVAILSIVASQFRACALPRGSTSNVGNLHKRRWRKMKKVLNNGSLL